MTNSEVTVFVISCGESCLPNCLAAIKKQNISLTINEIKDVAPMSNAFNEMILRCKTPYYIQVDADMTLEKFAVATLLQAIKKRGNKCAEVCAALKDPVRGILYGVKIFNHSIMKNFRYQNVNACDRRIVEEYTKKGYTRDAIGTIVGTHAEFYNNSEIMLKSRAIIEKDRYLTGSINHLNKCYKKLSESKFSLRNLFEFLGAYEGFMAKKSDIEEERDYRKFNRERLMKLDGILSKIDGKN